jgi:hypothetical protein
MRWASTLLVPCAMLANGPQWTMAGADELAQHRALADDVSVGADVGGARRVLGQHRQVTQATDIIQNPVARQMLGDGDRVERLAAVSQR